MTKVAAKSADGFLKGPPSDIRAILFYGPDGGLARERMATAALTVVPALDDPFLVSEIAGDGLSDDPARLGDEAAAIAMTGGRRVVIVRDAAESASPALSAFLDAPVGDALVLVTAGDLGPRSKLRKAFEGAKIGAAIACYRDEGGDLSSLIAEGLRPLGVRIDRDAKDLLTEILGSDRAVSRSEIEKLALYAGPDGHLDRETVAVLIGDSSATALDDICFAVSDGRADLLERSLELLSDAGTPAVQILRAASNHVLRLHRVQDMAASGQDMGSAMASLKPPVFFKTRPRFESVVKRVPPAALTEALSVLMTAEAACKRTGAPDALLCDRALQQAAALCRRAGRRR